jgi:hypothetical protein
MTMAAIKIQQEQEEKTKIQQEAVAKQVSQALVHQFECIETKQEMELLLKQLKQLQDSVDTNITREKKLKQDVV